MLLCNTKYNGCDMTIFEPLFLLLALATLATLVTAAGLAAAGRWARAARILRRLGLAAALYFAMVILVSLVRPPPQYRVAEERCFDDWCLTVVAARRTPAPRPGYDVTLRLTSHARQRPMGERGTVVYLIDAERRRYEPVEDRFQPPFDTILEPGQSVTTARRFDVPAAARDVGLVYAHEGGFPIGWFIIGEDGWFRRPAIVPLE